MAFGKTGVIIRHASRDCIRLDISYKDGPSQPTYLSYDQAYDLKQQLESFLGDYKPEE